MIRLKAALAALTMAALAGCSALDPFATVAQAPRPGQPAGQRVGICYDRLASSLAEVAAAAQRQCGAGTVARRVDTDWYLLYCPLLLPSHASFVCSPQK
jgi:hypothetical protein